MLLMGLATPIASAATIELFEFAFNVDGDIWDSLSGDPIPANINLSGFNQSTGIGVAIVNVAAGPHTVIGFFDHEINETDDTFFNEFGEVNGAPPSWEIDEPGYVFGDIFTNFSNSDLDNSNGVPEDTPDDVSMALGLTFDNTQVNFHLATSLPNEVPDFYLRHTNEETNIYFWATAGPEGAPIPEPSTIILVLSGLGLAVAARFRRSF